MHVKHTPTSLEYWFLGHIFDTDIFQFCHVYGVFYSNIVHVLCDSKIFTTARL